MKRPGKYIVNKNLLDARLRRFRKEKLIFVHTTSYLSMNQNSALWLLEKIRYLKVVSSDTRLIVFHISYKIVGTICQKLLWLFVIIFLAILL